MNNFKINIKIDFPLMIVVAAVPKTQKNSSSFFSEKKAKTQAFKNFKTRP